MQTLQSANMSIFGMPGGGGPQLFEVKYEDLSVVLICPDCGEDPPKLVEEFASGDVVCGSCGRVLADQQLDTRPEWRNFSNDEENHDRSRVGDAADELLYGSQLHTHIAPDGAPRNRKGLQHAHNEASRHKENEQLVSGYADIRTLCSNAQMPQVVIKCAQQVYKDAIEKGALKQRRKSPAAVGACIIIACKSEGLDRSFDEIAKLTGASIRDLNRIFKLYRKVLQGQGDQSARSSDAMKSFQSTKPSVLVPRFASKLLLPKPLAMLAEDLAEQVAEAELLVGSRPTSIAAGCIHLAVHGKRLVTDKEIASVAGCSVSTLKKVVQSLDGKLRLPNSHQAVKPVSTGMELG